MTTQEFVQSKFGLFLLTGLAIFFSGISILCLLLSVWYPQHGDIFTGLADWFTKAAIGPLIGALINSIITPHDGTRREDSSEFVAKNDTVLHQTTTTEKTVTPKAGPDITDPAVPIVVQKVVEPVKIEGEEPKP